MYQLKMKKLYYELEDEKHELYKEDKNIYLIFDEWDDSIKKKFIVIDGTIPKIQKFIKKKMKKLMMIQQKKRVKIWNLQN